MDSPEPQPLGAGAHAAGPRAAEADPAKSQSQTGPTTPRAVKSLAALSREGGKESNREEAPPNQKTVPTGHAKEAAKSPNRPLAAQTEPWAHNSEALTPTRKPLE